MSDKVTITLISTIGAVIVAVVTSFITAASAARGAVETQRPGLVKELNGSVATAAHSAIEKEKTDFVKEITNKVSVTGVPIGTVVPSMLDPRTFSKQVGDVDSSFDPKQSVWVPADGREVPGSKYASAISTRVPDLRGLFIRGLNQSEEDRDRLAEPGSNWADPDGKHRQPGSFQADSLATHRHEVPGVHQVAAGRAYWVYSHDATNTTQPRTTLFWHGSKETRPKNAAMFYYIKIN